MPMPKLRKLLLLAIWMALPSSLSSVLAQDAQPPKPLSTMEVLIRELDQTTSERDELAAALNVARAEIRLLEARLAERDKALAVAATQLEAEKLRRKGFWEDHIRVCTGVGAAYNPVTGTADGGLVGVLGWAW